MRNIVFAVGMLFATQAIALPAINMQIHNRTAQDCFPPECPGFPNGCFRHVTCARPERAVPSPLGTPGWWTVKPHRVA